MAGDTKRNKKEHQSGETTDATPRPINYVGSARKAQISSEEFKPTRTQIRSQKIEPKRTNVKTSVSVNGRKTGPSDDQVAAARREGQKRAEEENRKRRQQYENAFGGTKRRFGDDKRR